MQFKIFGREPAAFVSVLAALLTLLAAPDLGFISPGQAVAIIGALTALVLALTTRPIAPAILTGAVTAIAGMFAEFGLEFSDDGVAAAGAAVLALFAFITREQVSPKETVITNA